LKNLKDLDFYLVTNSTLSKNDIFSDTENAIKAGCQIVQYREKNKATKAMIAEAEKIKEICKDKAIFLIDDRVDVALAVDADGVHLGQNDISVQTTRKILGSNKMIGLTVHNVAEALNAVSQGVNYIGLAPIFATDTKDDVSFPCGIEMISKVSSEVNLPIVAVGGINRNNVGEVIKKGADSVVSISAVIGIEDVYSEVKEFIRIIKESKLK